MTDHYRPPFCRSLLSLPLLLTCMVLMGSASGQAQSTFELKEGDRVAFLGNTFVERAIHYGHLESALSARWPDRNIVFRNIGWSGDAPNGRARAFFGSIQEGFDNMQTHLSLADPSVIFVAYGAMAAFEGKPGLDGFIQEMNTLLDVLEKRTKRIVLLSPTPREDLGAPLPDPEKQNRNLSLYTKALESLAKERGYHFVDLFTTLETRSPQKGTRAITDNGVHLNEYGYALAAERIAQSLTGALPQKRVAVEKDGSVSEASGVSVLNAGSSERAISLELRDDQLGLPYFEGDFSRNLTLVARNLPRGQYALEYEGKILATGSHAQWDKGIQLAWEPSRERAADLLEVVKRKNDLFFHQWRPQNETYLRGFRKHEQGQNAAELPLFDPFIEAEEAKIAELKRPQPYRLVLKRTEGGEG